MNYPYQFSPQVSQMQQIQQMFPQPQGSVYSINSPVDIGNVPIGSTGLSVVLCLSEDVMYIKSFQNGTPVIMAYKVEPFSKELSHQEDAAPVAPNPVEARIESLEKLVSDLIDALPKKEVTK